jgi:RyR domain/ATPase family associated with various cellular activities (AAA)
MIKTVLVTGDLLQQVDLVPEQVAPYKRGGSLPALTVENPKQPGGTLASLVEAACSDLTPRILAAGGQAAAGQSYVLWDLFPPEPEKKDKAGQKTGVDRVWRVCRHLGLVQPVATPDLQAEAEADPSNPDILLIDDLGLGFRDNPSRWPQALRDDGELKSIILKCGVPLVRSSLWEYLLKHHADRLTVIVPVHLLRARGAKISAPLSWDLTIEEIAREFKSGTSAGDLARVRRVIVPLQTDGAASFSRLDPYPLPKKPKPGLRSSMEFERCLYDPANLEGSWETTRPGSVIDGPSLIAAAMVRHELSPETYPLFIALGRALAAARAAHTNGAGPAGKRDFAAPITAVQKTLHPQSKTDEPARIYYSAFSHECLDNVEQRTQPGKDVAPESDLLRDLMGSDRASAIGLAIEVVLQGPKMLAAAPQARIGNFFTVDRDESERLHSVRNLILTYKAHLEDKHPLALAVFGPPGSGKTFIVKEMATEIGGPDTKCIEFNVSQFTSVDDLHRALHHVRDAAVKGQMPFVFFDEFDTNKLEWLKHFLVPMREGVFQWKGSEFPVGRSVFVFAGGTKSRFEDFDQGEAVEEFREKKGPDFVSRLRGYIDIKGINPPEFKRPGEVSDHSDTSHIIRRALLLRLALQRQFPEIVNPATGEMSISTSVARSFLLAKKYLHGGRSLESIISMSHLRSGPSFGPSDLPAHNLILMHVTPDFLNLLGETSLSAAEVESIAAVCHGAWFKARTEDGWRLGERDDSTKKNPMLKAYAELDEVGKKKNRSSARGTLAHLFGLGLKLRREANGVPAVARLSDSQRKALGRAEHDRWLRESLLQGWAGGESTDPALRLNQDIVPYDRLRNIEKPLDLTALDATLGKLSELGYSLTGEVRGRTLDDAIALAIQAHRGQRDKRDESYFLHVFRVMLRQDDETARIVGVLHDSLEDTSVTLTDLHRAGFSDEVCEAVDCLTRRPGEPYEDMIARVAANPLSRRVKLGDLEDNMDPKRQLEGPEGAEHLAKYQAAWKRLSEVR